MPYSIKDLEQAGRAINAHFERRAEQRGEALARRMLQRTAEGRGLWCLLLWPAWFTIFFASVSFLEHMLKNILSIAEPPLWVPLACGLLVATGWYRWGYTRRHPFLSTLFGCMVVPSALVLLTMNLAGQ